MGETEKPIRVAQIMGKLWAGGVEAVVFNYYRAIDKSKVQFDFYYDADSTVEPPQDLVDMGAGFNKVPPYQQLPKYLKTLLGYFRKNKYQIIHSHINTLSVFPLFAAWVSRIPVRVAHNHSVPNGREFKRNALKYFLRQFATIFPTHYFACSEKAGKWLFGTRNYNEGKITVIRNAIDFDRFAFSEPKRTELRSKLHITDKFVVGHVGRFTYAKNHMFLLDVFSEISKKNENAVLILVGDGELHDEVIGKIKELDLEGKVILTGKVQNPEDYYHAFDIMVMPSVFEGLPLTVIEAQIAQIPIIVSEAISEEAVISNGCKYRSLKNTADEWAEAALKCSQIEVVLNEKSQMYNIRNQASNLMNWYLQRSKEL